MKPVPLSELLGAIPLFEDQLSSGSPTGSLFEGVLITEYSGAGLDPGPGGELHLGLTAAEEATVARNYVDFVLLHQKVDAFGVLGDDLVLAINYVGEVQHG